MEMKKAASNRGPAVGSGFKIGPATIDAIDILHVEIDGHRFFAGEKYTILEQGWAVYLAEGHLPEDWLRQYGETSPARDGWNELASKGNRLITSHPVLVALALRAWWHRNGSPVPTAPTVPIPTFAEAVEEVRRRKIRNDFNERYKGDVPGLEKWSSVTPEPISHFTEGR